MKSIQKQLIKTSVFAFLFVFSFSCDQKGESVNEREIDSTDVSDPAREQNDFFVPDSLHSGNAVRVQLDSSHSFDWDTFRQKFHESESSDEVFSPDVAVGPWVTWNEYEYRQVYRYTNDALWIQTFYRSHDSTRSNQNQTTVLLDSQDPNYVQFGPLWSDMLTRGHHLTDSLR